MSSRARSGLAVVPVAGLAGLAIVVLATAGGSAAAAYAGMTPRFTASSTTGRFELAADAGHATVLVRAGWMLVMCRLDAEPRAARAGQPERARAAHRARELPA